MIAPFPERDSVDVPYKFVALTVAIMEEPQARLNGVVLKLVIGTEHNRFATIVDRAPLQSVN
jgi:hypothetical protein